MKSTEEAVLSAARPDATTAAFDVLSTQQLRAAWERMEPIRFGDPVFAHAEMKLRANFFPLGFPVTIATNSPAVLKAAHQSWSRFTRQFETDPIRLQIGVTEGDSLICPPMPVCRMRDHLVMNIADGENFSICDLSQGSAVVWVTRAALEHADYFRYFFLESAAMCNISGRYVTAIHAGCVGLDDSAVLLCGDSGAGKSTLSYACAQAGWTYTTDDGSFLIHGGTNRMVVGNCHQFRFRPTAESLFPELHGLPVLQRAGVGKPSIELLTAPAESVHTSGTARVKHIVFLKRNVPEQALVEFPVAVARLYMQQTVHCMPYRAAMKQQAIERLLEAGAYELQYNDLDWAVDRLAQLVREDR
jgi:hypothetical protein